MLTPSMLTLDRSTLFYWTLYSDQERKRKRDDGDDDEIVSWVNKIPSNARPVSRARSRAPKSSRSSRQTRSSCTKSVARIPSLTNGSMEVSVATDDTKATTGHKADAPAKVKADPGDSSKYEIQGKEAVKVRSFFSISLQHK
jgi:hypothetical protein